MLCLNPRRRPKEDEVPAEVPQGVRSPAGGYNFVGIPQWPVRNTQGDEIGHRLFQIATPHAGRPLEEGG